ncbi:uncharacterized protein LOC108596949 [Drosophila busckii]|uniref:uncharacterized protein LOC108596949 n=1 Tax=Drosophila busckii TaxID=30019 RepID=UPI00083F0688|nr:uncharacterized protein LOC108596949 [Drosophila busckii]
MPFLLVLLLVSVITALAYLCYIIHKKAINPKEIRIYNLQDAKNLLTLPTSSGPQRYLAKMA